MAGMPTLTTERLRLRAFTTADTDSIFEIFSSAAVVRYWDSPAWTDKGQAYRFIEKSVQIERNQTGFRMAVDDLDSGILIGQCSVFAWNTTFRTVKLGYCFRESSWGRGVATEAVAAVLAWAFDNLDINRVQAETDTRNVASGRVLLKQGFVHEGTLREDCIVSGEISSTHIYGLLRRDHLRMLTGA